MTTKAFNNYIDMYYKEHPGNHSSEELLHLIDSTYDTPGETVELQVNSIDRSPDNIIVVPHPWEANNKSKQHSHDYFELIYVSRGTSTQRILDQKCDMKAGDFCLLNPSITHRIDIDTKDTLLFNIMIKTSLFKNSFLYMITGNDLICNFFTSSLYAESTQRAYLYFAGEENTTAANHIQSLIIEFLEKKLGYQKVTENYLALLFMELARGWQEIIDKENYSLMGNNHLSEILAYINQKKQSVTLASVAEHFHYHPKYLSSLIKKYTNKSFSEIVQEAKLQEARYYLETTNMSVDEIAQIVGYYDRSYFNRTFKKYFDMSPSGYRERSMQR